jgi:hypothetical protein
MKNLLSFLFLLLLMPQLKAEARVKQDSVLESKILDLILSLPEVKQANLYVMKHTNNKRHLFDYINDQPAKKGGDYTVMVAEDNGSTYHTHFIFLVNSKTLKIKYSDVITGEDIPLEVLRRDKKRHKILEYN